MNALKEAGQLPLEAMTRMTHQCGYDNNANSIQGGESDSRQCYLMDHTQWLEIRGLYAVVCVNAVAREKPENDLKNL